jgi:hypothetical protein
MGRTRRQRPGPDGPPVTTHARKRVRERLGLPARAVRRMAQRAWDEGKRLHELPTPVRLELLDRQRMHEQRTGTEAELVVYRGFLFLFNKYDRALITTFPVKTGKLTDDQQNSLY